MIDPRTIIEYENEILELIDDRDYYTNSDLQGRVQAIVIKIIEREVKNAQ